MRYFCALQKKRLHLKYILIVVRLLLINLLKNTEG
jgi:hypothetical protein